jgi:transposase
MDIDVLGIDLGKNSCSVVGQEPTGGGAASADAPGGIVALAAKLSGCVVAMEAYCGAHHLGCWPRRGTSRLMSPEDVRPRRQGAEERRSRRRGGDPADKRFVALKSEAQLDVQVLHRMRDWLVG